MYKQKPFRNLSRHVGCWIDVSCRVGKCGKKMACVRGKICEKPTFCVRDVLFSTEYVADHLRCSGKLPLRVSKGERIWMQILVGEYGGGRFGVKSFKFKRAHE